MNAVLLTLYFQCTLYIPSKQKSLTHTQSTVAEHSYMYYVIQRTQLVHIAVGMCTFKVSKNHMTFVNANFSTLTTMYATSTSNQQTMVYVHFTYCSHT